MLYFFDTSALQHRYINSGKSRSIRRTISDRRNENYVAGATIIEIASTFARHCRSNHLSRKDYQRLDLRFWRDVQNSTIRIRESRQRDFERALHLIAYAGVDLKRKITSFDALIAATCLDLALERSTRVTFCIEDWKLYDVIRRVSAYSSALAFKFIGTSHP
jgi:predicted nucleic acid-binding protein